jgi:UDP-glucose 4-epimerase
VSGSDYPTPDGTCVRDYIHVSDLVRAHCGALAICLPAATRRRSIAVIEVIDTVKCVSGIDFAVKRAARRPGRSGADRRQCGSHPLDSPVAATA